MTSVLWSFCGIKSAVYPYKGYTIEATIRGGFMKFLRSNSNLHLAVFMAFFAGLLLIKTTQAAETSNSEKTTQICSCDKEQDGTCKVIKADGQSESKGAGHEDSAPASSK